MTTYSLSDFRRDMRDGQFAWPGGYQLYFVLEDGGALSFAAAWENKRQILEALRDSDDYRIHGGNVPRDDYWRVVGVDVNYEDTELYCVHTGNQIPASQPRGVREMTSKPDMLLWLNDARGIYIPQDFANSFKDRAKSVVGVSDADWEILEAGPDHENYWHAWNDVCYGATVTDENGVKYTVWQDGDCWLIPEGMEWDDEQGVFTWPSDDDEQDQPENDANDVNLG